ncbi:hypothetical protein F5880DRAFT_378038 [Lentinula raphanica]|nr:hypothetical protein F5880DRAFT_378038 [Lentinula raphanica]
MISCYNPESWYRCLLFLIKARKLHDFKSHSLPLVGFVASAHSYIAIFKFYHSTHKNANNQSQPPLTHSKDAAPSSAFPLRRHSAPCKDDCRARFFTLFNELTSWGWGGGCLLSSKATCDIRHYPAPTSPPSEGPFSQYDDQVSEALKILWTPDFWVETEATSDESLWVPSATVSDDQFSELVRTFLFDRKEDVTLVAVTEVSTGTILHVVVFEGNSFDKGHVVFRPGEIFFHFAKGKYWFPGSEETKMSFPTYKMQEIKKPNSDGHFVTYLRPCHREPAQIQPPPESQPPTVQRNRNSRECSIGFMFSFITFQPFRKAYK